MAPVSLTVAQNLSSMKSFNLMTNIGSAKYVVNHHDGVKTHADGRPFFDSEIFRNKKKLKAFMDELGEKGYVRTC